MLDESTWQDIDRVVVINDQSFARGGAAVLALRSVERMLSLGVQVTYVCGDDSGRAALERQGAQVVALGGTELLSAPFLEAASKGIYNRDARDMLARLIAGTDTPRTIYHLHGWSQILSPAIFDALRAVAPRVLIHAHDFFLACPNGAFMDYHHGQPCHRKPLSLGCLATHCDKRSYAQKIWRVLRQQRLAKSFAKTLPWGGVLMIHPAMQPFLELAGIPAKMLVTLRNPVTPWTEARIPAERNDRILFVGRVAIEKGITDCIEAARRAGVGLTVAGDGELRAELQAKHPEVEFLGWSDRKQIARAAQQARAVIMPSRYPEPFGLVAVEASQSGLPVIVGDTALLADEIESRGLGLAFKSDDLNAMADALTRMRDMPAPDVAAMSKRALAADPPLALTEEDWIDNLLSLYRTTLGQPQPSRPKAAPHDA